MAAENKSQATQLIWILSISYIEVFSRRSSPSAVSLSINWIYCSFSPKMLSEIIHMNWTNLVWCVLVGREEGRDPSCYFRLAAACPDSGVMGGKKGGGGIF